MHLATGSQLIADFLTHYSVKSYISHAWHYHQAETSGSQAVRGVSHAWISEECLSSVTRPDEGMRVHATTTTLRRD